MIVGDGVLCLVFEWLVDDFGIVDDVIFVGYDFDFWLWLVFVDVFVLLLDYEGFGNVLVEVFYVGFLVVSIDCESGLCEIFGDGVYGLFVLCGDLVVLVVVVEWVFDGLYDFVVGCVWVRVLFG